MSTPALTVKIPLTLVIALASLWAALAPLDARANPTLGCAANNLVPVYGSNWGTGLVGDETYVHIDGDPLLIAVGSRGSVAVWICQPSPKNIQYQYYGMNAWGTNIWLNGTDTAQHYVTNYYGSTNRLTAGSQTITHVGALWTVTTVMGLASAAQLKQVITYQDGSYNYKIRWELANTSATTYSDVRLFHGGDTYFGGDDSARSWWNPSQNMVYVNNSQFLTSGIMGFYGAPATPATHYFSGHYSTGRSLAMSTARLNDTNNSSYVDAGYQLEWDRATLAPGATWIIEAFEAWTDPTYVQVLAPADQLSPPGATTSLSFGVHNLDTSSHTFTLSAASDLGWTTTLAGDAEITVPGLSQANVDVQIAIPAGATIDSVGKVTVTAIDESVGSRGSAFSSVRVFQPNYTISPTSLDFGSLGSGQAATRTVTLTNSGSAVQISTVGSPNGLTAPFSVVSDGCSNRSIANGGSCTITVQMTASGDGAFNDVFNIPITAPVVTSVNIATLGEVVSASCTDGASNGAETGVDCGGGTCDPCATGGACAFGSDCASGVCTGGTCRAPTCSDGVSNGDETGPDCGGPSCGPCADGAACSVAADCLSGVCGAGMCQAPSCSDGVTNGDEPDTDCGGPCGACDDGADCVVNADCSSGSCINGVCAVALTVTTSDDARVYEQAGAPVVVDPAITVLGAGTIDGARVMISAGLRPSEDVLAFSAQSGITGSYDPTLGILTLTGTATVAAYEAALRSVTYRDQDTTHPTAGDRTFTFSLGQSGLYLEATGHFYEFVTGRVTWHAARDAATARKYFGLKGYLATITSATENGFVASKLQGQGWMGASDAGSENTWRWVTGPEGLEDGGQGRYFFLQSGGGGSAVGGYYNGWASGEPNNWGGDEDYAHFYVDGRWNDYKENNFSIQGYVVEYGGLAGDPLVKLSDARVLTVHSCFDGALNLDESDVDCGGAVCAACGDGRACEAAGDCTSFVCAGGVCQAPRCDDGVKNGAEIDVDCGGACDACGDGAACGAASHCQSGVCAGGVCQVPTCSDAVRNGFESGVDCGGPSCGRCADGGGCAVAGDCQSAVCAGGVCQVPTCDDGVKNGLESDVDCAGSCATCGAGHTCGANRDCASRVCADGVCQAPSCTDDTQNGGETGPDCGGPCGPCWDGSGCAVASDCRSGVCTGGICRAPLCTDGVKNG
ncbi:MAG: hypothetical protein CVU56_03490, partial [Deltaproteobacteria bacterium HGW-Deltaproteobacteria-14]